MRDEQLQARARYDAAEVSGGAAEVLAYGTAVVEPLEGMRIYGS